MKNYKRKNHLLKNANDFLKKEDLHLSDPGNQEMSVVVYDLDELSNKLYELKMQQLEDENSMTFLEDKIQIRQMEIDRIEAKVSYLQ